MRAIPLRAAKRRRASWQPVTGWPAAITARLLPEIDARAWVFAAAIGVFGLLFLKDTPPSLALLAVAVGALAWWSRHQPELGLYALIAYLPFSRFAPGAVGPEALNLTNALIGWVALTCLLSRLKTSAWWLQPHPLHAAVLAFMALCVWSLLRAGWLYGAWYAWDHLAQLKRWLTPPALYLLTIWVVRDRRAVKTALALILAAVAAVSAMAIWEYYDRAGSSFERARIRGIAGNANLIAAFLVYYMFLFLSGFLTWMRRWGGWVLLAAFLLAGRGMMGAFSRGAYLACAAGLLTMCWFHRKWLFGVALGVGLLAMSHPSLLPAGVRYRMNMTVAKGHTVSLEGNVRENLEENLEPSAATRVKIWTGAWRMVQEHPWWGVGYGAFPVFLPHYAQLRRAYVDAHNTFLMITAEMGAVTTAAFIAVLGLAGVTAWRLRRLSRDETFRMMALGFLGGLAALTLSNTFSSCMDAQEVVSYFWILCALIVRAWQLERQPEAPAA